MGSQFLFLCLVTEMRSQRVSTTFVTKRIRSLWYSILIILLIETHHGLDAFGQNPSAGTTPQNGTAVVGNGFGGFGSNQNMVTEFRGKLKGFQRGVVYVQKEDGTDAMVQLPESIADFQFFAIAKPAFLRRGQLVRLSGMFNPVNGLAIAPISKVELFQPVSGKLNGNRREQFVPGIYPRHNAENPQAFAQPVSCLVVGAVMGLGANGMLMVQAGGRPLQIPLASDATFEIRYNNLSLAQEGDQVSVTGFYQPPNEQHVRAERITVTTERIYGEQSEATPVRRGSRVRSTRTPKAEGNAPAGEENVEEMNDLKQEGNLSPEAAEKAVEAQD